MTTVDFYQEGIEVLKKDKKRKLPNLPIVFYGCDDLFEITSTFDQKTYVCPVMGIDTNEHHILLLMTMLSFKRVKYNRFFLYSILHEIGHYKDERVKKIFNNNPNTDWMSCNTNFVINCEIFAWLFARTMIKKRYLEEFDDFAIDCLNCYQESFDIDIIFKYKKAIERKGNEEFFDEGKE